MSIVSRETVPGQASPQEADSRVRRLLQTMPGFTAVPAANGVATVRHLRDSRLTGLSYNIQAVPDGEGYRIYIESWVYGVQDDAISMPVLDFAFSLKSDNPADIAVQHLKVLSRALPESRYNGSRAMSVALFLINQINAGQVPDCVNILKLHGLHAGGGI